MVKYAKNMFFFQIILKPFYKLQYETHVTFLTVLP